MVRDILDSMAHSGFRRILIVNGHGGNGAVQQYTQEWTAHHPDCRVIFYGAPALMHPTTGVVFAFAGGTHTYALRLPEAERADALRAGATRAKHYPAGQSFDLSEIGDEWVFCGWFRGEEEWCLAAFELAAR